MKNKQILEVILWMKVDKAKLLNKSLLEIFNEITQIKK